MTIPHQTNLLLDLHRIFPRLGMTIGEMLQASVFHDSTNYIIVPQGTDADAVTIDLTAQTWGSEPLESTPTGEELDSAALYQFWSEVATMLDLMSVSQAHIVQNPLELREFDANDWLLWPETLLPDDAQPQVAYDLPLQGFANVSQATLTVDAEGIQLYMYTGNTEDDAEQQWELVCDWHTALSIVAELTQPLTPEQLRKHRFVKVA